MTETLFYHLENNALEEVLPSLLERTRERNWRAVVRVGSAERLSALDTHLWTYTEHGFLAHGTAADGFPARQPIYLTTENDNPNSADVLFFVGGAAPDSWSTPDLSAHKRVVYLFDGRDDEALQGARTAWKSAQAAGHDVTYWKQSSAGKWEKQA